ncbi:unnamed protein product [Larinioides sclopetarius]|uniref:Uncharacterized protein n=1 Tax=Larinioides sclopetarius TaxID=280406 RepID=A0AAV2AFI5_9ARAC
MEDMVAMRLQLVQQLGEAVATMANDVEKIYMVCSILLLFFLSHSVTGHFLGGSDVYRLLRGIDVGRGGLSGRAFGRTQEANINFRRQGYSAECSDHASNPVALPYLPVNSPFPVVTQNPTSKCNTT